MLEPIKIIIQDFPKYISEYLSFDLFAFLMKAKSKMKIIIRNAKVDFKIRATLISQFVKLYMVIYPHFQIATRSTAVAKMVMFINFHHEFGFKVDVVDKLVKLWQIASFLVRIGFRAKLSNDSIKTLVKALVNVKFNLDIFIDDNLVKNKFIMEPYIKIGFRANIYDEFVKLKEKILPHISIRFNVLVNNSLVRTYMKLSGRMRLGNYKFRLVPGYFVIGKALRLKDWDPVKLGDMDGKTMFELSLEDYTNL